MATTSKHDNYLVSDFKDSSAFEKWLHKNHGKSEGIWIRIAKANAGIPSITHTEALDVALCYGWIDGLRRGLDEQYFLQKFTPRQARSIWSVINQKKVAALIKSGRMQEAGLNAIKTAKANGRWASAYEGQKSIKVPEDLQTAIDKNKKAKAFFEKLTSQNRYAIIFRTIQVKRPETRAKKIAQFVAMLEKNETIYKQ